MPPSVTVETRTGRTRIPRSRSLVVDILRLHQRNLTVAHNRYMQLAEVADARSRSPIRISWSALFIKAWAEVSSSHPILRQTWRDWPWGHIFQHRESVATLAVNRQHGGEDWLFWGLVRSPERLSLVDIQSAIDTFNNAPPESQFHKQLKLAALPTMARRFIWWWNLNIAGEKRGKRLGTFSLTSISGRGAEIQHPPTVMTTGLTFGPLDHDARMKVTLVYDHRLMDGSFIANRLVDLEQQLTGPVLTELQALTDFEPSANAERRPQSGSSLSHDKNAA
jgi:hypothetical protein